MKFNNTTSWIWRGILNVKSELRKIVDFNMGNGRKTSFWDDPWLQGLSLLEKFPRVKMKDSDIPWNTLVANLLRHGRWVLPDPSDEDMAAAWNYIKQNCSVSDRDDEVKWKVVKNNNFSINQTWKEYREKYPEVSWHKIVWNKGYMPRFSFILWLILRDRVKTKDKLKKWGVTEDDICVLCPDGVEFVNHYFFNYEFATCIWRSVLKACHCSIEIRSWRSVISWFSRRAAGKNNMAEVRRLALSAIVYYIWTARNKKVFAKETQTAEMVMRKIKTILTDKISTMKPDQRLISIIHDLHIIQLVCLVVLAVCQKCRVLVTGLSLKRKPKGFSEHMQGHVHESKQTKILPRMSVFGRKYFQPVAVNGVNNAFDRCYMDC
ncbi:uncharacterized protein LOC126681497 [Mercurialis annua]|uniref:uncharacterized protein LOC126681497 n=1 Tax=Mercurialis annua TaxID=3986 RepID=UPI00215DFACB|nr:uncharacterized protein LOC126681497 [Mercurialis annua]